MRSYTAVSKSIMTNVSMSSTSVNEFLTRNDSKGVPKALADGRFVMGRRIGAGAFGQVFEAQDTVANVKVAIKFEKTQNTRDKSQLMAELRIYRLLGKKAPPGVPKIYYFGSEGYYNIMAVDLLGPSLNDLLLFCKEFSAKTTMMLTFQMIRLIQNIHELGFIHRDIKPDNFVMGLGEKGNHVYLIDFGLAKRFVNAKTKQHIPFRMDKGFTGTARYASVAGHLGYEQSRKDDMEALAYMLAFFGNGSLPWQTIVTRDRNQRKLIIQESKLNTSIAEVMGVLPSCFCEYMRYVKGLAFEARPDYEMLTRIIMNEFKDRGYKNDWKYDWFEKTNRIEQAEAGI